VQPNPTRPGLAGTAWPLPLAVDRSVSQ